MKRTTRTTALGILLLVGVVVALGTAFATSASRPSAVLGSYVLFAGQALQTRGLSVATGNVGVNAGELIVKRTLDARSSQVAANSIRYLRAITCTVRELFANTQLSGACGVASGVATPFTGSILGPNVELQQACGFPSPIGCNTKDASRNVFVGLGERRHLASDGLPYGALSLRGANTTLVLDGGDYTFCSIRSGRATYIIALAPVTIKVFGDVKFGDISYTGPGEGAPITASDIHLFVAGRNVGFRQRAEVHALVCAPDADLRVNRHVRAEGSFVARQITVDSDTAMALTGGFDSGSTTTTTTTTSTTRPTTVCGNSVKEPGEACDPPGSKTCPAPGSPTGAFVCNANCTCPSVTTTTVSSTSTSSTTSTTVPAATCGNGVLEPGEACDRSEFGGTTCPGGSPSGAGLRCVDGCTRIDNTGCSATAGVEICGNCIDDDGDGLTDFEDPDCCIPAHSYTTARSNVRIVPGAGTSRLRLRSLLARAGLASVDPTKQGVVLQIRAQDARTDLFCAPVPPERFVAKRRRFRFRDPELTVESARGISAMVVRIANDGSVRLAARGKQVKLTSPKAGPLQLTVGFRSPSAGNVANRCSTIIQGFRSTRRGGLRAP